jgi:hypothetical protein
LNADLADQADENRIRIFSNRETHFVSFSVVRGFSSKILTEAIHRSAPKMRNHEVKKKKQEKAFRIQIRSNPPDPLKPCSKKKSRTEHHPSAFFFRVFLRVRCLPW